MAEEAGSSSSTSSSSGQARSKAVDKNSEDTIFADLMAECRHSAPGARLSARLRTALERLPWAARRRVVSRTSGGCAPLFVACARGNVELAEYLLHVGGAPLEQRGVYEVPADRSVHSVTPLWCAAVSGHVEVVKALCAAGAEVDASSDSGSTPVRSACFMSHISVVRALVARGADLRKANHNGGTCLINSVQSAKLCHFLLQHGAEVDARDMQLKTALHYAIQEHRLETAKLLLDHGADPMLESRAGDDALRTACLKGAGQIVSLLLTRATYSPERRAEALELLGATQMDEFNDLGAALAAWRRATAIRHPSAGPAHPKRQLPADTRTALGGAADAREWDSPDELDAAAADADSLRAQALLVAARVLGERHRDTVFRVMYRGAAYADAFRYERCITLWTWALRVRIDKDSLLYTDTCQTACALARLMLDASSGRLERVTPPDFESVRRVYALLVDAVPECQHALSIRPVHRKQAETFDRALRCLTHLIHLLLAAAGADPARQAVVRTDIRRLVSLQPRSAHTGDSLLHLAASRLNVIRSTYTADDAPDPGVFPSAAVAGALCAAGADVGAKNDARSTPLHVAAVPYNFSTELVECLLSWGAHLDQPNKFGDSALSLISLQRASGVRPLRHVTLACLCARALAPSRAAPRVLPATLRAFLELHRP